MVCCPKKNSRLKKGQKWGKCGVNTTKLFVFSSYDMKHNALLTHWEEQSPSTDECIRLFTPGCNQHLTVDVPLLQCISVCTVSAGAV